MICSTTSFVIFFFYKEVLILDLDNQVEKYVLSGGA